MTQIRNKTGRGKWGVDNEGKDRLRGKVGQRDGHGTQPWSSEGEDVVVKEEEEEEYEDDEEED